MSARDQDRINFLVNGLRDFGISQKKFAEQLGVTPETVSRWRNGKAEIPSYAVARLTLLYSMKTAIDTLQEGMNG